MTEYPNLAELRGVLTSDNPNTRAEAYKAVLDAGIQPTEVLGDDPPVEDLRAEGVIPPEDDADVTTASDQRERIIELLEELTGGDA